MFKPVIAPLTHINNTEPEKIEFDSPESPQEFTINDISPTVHVEPEVEDKLSKCLSSFP